MSDHTPGPWVVSGYRILSTRTLEDVVALGPGVGYEGTQDDANARLIAAAPEMLALLRQIYTTPCECPLNGNGPDIPKAVGKLLTKIDGKG